MSSFDTFVAKIRSTLWLPSFLMESPDWLERISGSHRRRCRYAATPKRNHRKRLKHAAKLRLKIAGEVRRLVPKRVSSMASERPETKSRFRLWFGGGAAMKRIWQPVTYFLAVVYFLVDLIFFGLARPISEWVSRHLILRKLRNWIRSLPP